MPRAPKEIAGRILRAFGRLGEPLLRLPLSLNKALLHSLWPTANDEDPSFVQRDSGVLADPGIHVGRSRQYERAVHVWREDLG
jgi:hypothetical protein